CVARAFGSQRLIRDALIAAVFALVAYSGFDGVLGYKIGAGGIDPYVSQAIERLQKLILSGAR
ncbi:MAG: hypothetical protein RL291_1904, partial [Pseudomonadota bacterium]